MHKVYDQYVETGEAALTLTVDGEERPFRVIGTELYRVDTNKLRTVLVNVETGERWTVGKLFKHLGEIDKQHEEPLVLLQTCYEKNNNWSWGRLLVWAVSEPFGQAQGE